MHTALPPQELRRQCAARLKESVERAGALRAFVGLDGFVDEIIHAVDKRDSADNYQRICSITKFAERIAAAAGKSTNIELVNQLTKLGGNGPIMANALVSLGMRVSYVGALGYPTLHPVFQDFAARADVVSICEPGHTDALEFEDGKIMLAKSVQLADMNWANIQSRYGREKFAENFTQSDLVGFVNWTMIPGMTELWKFIQEELCPSLKGSKRLLFVDLADPEKRTAEDIEQALELLPKFNSCFDVVLGVNEKEAGEVGKVLGFKVRERSKEALSELARSIYNQLQIDTLVVHPVSYALTVKSDDVEIVDGPFISKPTITTGAGDHFNSGFCLGRLLGLNNAFSLLVGVTTSGSYVRTAKSPTLLDLADLMENWPESR